MNTYSYDRAVSVVSALLYAFDPGGMGSTVFAPHDEYDDPARRLVARCRASADLGELIRGDYPGSTDQLVAALVAVLELYLANVSGHGSGTSDG